MCRSTKQVWWRLLATVILAHPPPFLVSFPAEEDKDAHRDSKDGKELKTPRERKDSKESKADGKDKGLEAKYADLRRKGTKRSMALRAVTGEGMKVKLEHKRDLKKK